MLNTSFFLATATCYAIISLVTCRSFKYSPLSKNVWLLHVCGENGVNSKLNMSKWENENHTDLNSCYLTLTKYDNQLTKQTKIYLTFYQSGIMSYLTVLHV